MTPLLFLFCVLHMQSAPSWATDSKITSAPQFETQAAQSDNDTALIRAALMDDVDVVTALLAAGTNIDARDPVFGQTPLMWAASDGNADVVKILLGSGANASLTNTDGKTALDLAWGDAYAALKSTPVAIATAVQSHSSIQDQLANISRKLETLEASMAKPAPPQIRSDVDAPNYHLAEDMRKFALIIGIENYKSLPPARFAQRDAQSVRQFLLAAGYPAAHIAYLTEDSASRAAIAAYLESWLPKNLGGNSEVFVYFAGHGAPETTSGEAYLVPWDGDPNFLSQTGYPLKSFYERLARLKARRVIVALDSCFSGAGGRSVLPQGARPLITKVSGFAPAEHGLVVLCAASGDEIAGIKADQGHGLFTYYLLKGLEKFKGQADLKELFDYLKPQVVEWAHLGNQDQTPQFLPAGALASDKNWRL